MGKGKMIKIYTPGRQRKIAKAGKAGKIRLVSEKLRITGRK